MIHSSLFVVCFIACYKCSRQLSQTYSSGLHVTRFLRLKLRRAESRGWTACLLSADEHIVKAHDFSPQLSWEVQHPDPSLMGVKGSEWSQFASTDAGTRHPGAWGQQGRQPFSSPVCGSAGIPGSSADRPSPLTFMWVNVWPLNFWIKSKQAWTSQNGFSFL